MTRYRKTMAEAWNDSILIESGLMGTIKPDQLDNIKKIWAKKTMKDVTPGVKAMLAKLDMPTKVSVKHANINVLSKIVLDEKDPDEGVELDEGRMKDIFTADQEGKSAEEIAKRLKLPLGTVKKILGEDTQELQEFSKAQLDILARQFADLKGKTISIDRANQLRKIFDKIPNHFLNDLRKKHIPFLSGLALSRMIQKGIPVKEELEENAAVEIQKKVAKGGMDKAMFQKSVDLLKSKKYDELKTFLKKSDTSPREYVMSVIAKKEPATFKKMYGNQTGYYSLMNQNEELEEAKMPFRLSYDDKYGKHAGFEDAKTLQDLQNKAQKLRAKGFKINKMGRNTSPVEQKLPEPEGKREVEEDTDYLKSRLNPIQINNIKKTWSMKTAKDITPAVRAMIKKMDIPTQLAIKQANIPHLSKLVEGTDEALIEACWKGYTQVGMKEKDGKQVPNCVPNKDGKIPPQKKQEDKAHAIGMAKAKEIMKDEPPLEKKTIKKAHDIAKAIKRDESINSRTGPQKTFERIWMQHKRGDKRK